MAGSVNKVILIGHLGKDPEIRTLQSGDMIASLSIATSESWKDKNTGERKEKTEWHRVVIFNDNLAKIAEQYLKKGSPVYVEGALKTRSYTDTQGVERYVTEIVLQKFNGTLTLLGTSGSKGPPPADDPDSYGRDTTRTAGGYGPADATGRSAPQNFDLDDEIPF